jgi:tRNA (pseudouridine54-N1)-methyltransferase
MRRFLILFEDIPIDKTSVKSGSNSSEVVTACRCVNVGLFVSGNLRRDVIVSIAKGPIIDMRMVSFPGNDLKRVSPDERSISFFLLKSLIVAENLQQNSQQILDNGIIVTRDSFTRFISAYAKDRIFIARNGRQFTLDASIRLDNAILIYETCTQINLEDLESIDSGNFGLFSNQIYPLHPERFILDINEQIDNV